MQLVKRYFDFGCQLLLSVIAALALLQIAKASQIDAEAVRDISDTQVNERQLREAVASRTLTWLTGSSSNNDYISVGRTANYFGFVGLRVASGQSLTRSDVANDTLAVLNDAQRNALVALLQKQKAPFHAAQSARFDMNRALEGLLVSEPMSRDAFVELGRTYGISEALLGGVIAQGLGDIAQTLEVEQQASLTAIRAAHVSGQGQNIERKGLRLKLSKEDKQELVNLAARLLSWTTGSEELNEFEVVGKPSQHFGFVSLRIESNHGVRRGDVAAEVLDVLTAEQQRVLDAAAADNAREFGEFLQARANLMRTLEAALSGDTIDTEKLRQLGAAVGEIEASMTWVQATAMLQIRDSISEEQTIQLLAMREKYVASGDAMTSQEPIERGRQLFAQCALCHSESNRQAIGPNLTGIVGRKVAADPDYERYSRAMQDYASAGNAWSERLLDDFLKSPRSLLPGTYMSFDGLDSVADRAALIQYLRTLN